MVLCAPYIPAVFCGPFLQRLPACMASILPLWLAPYRLSFFSISSSLFSLDVDVFVAAWEEASLLSTPCIDL